VFEEERDVGLEKERSGMNGMVRVSFGRRASVVVCAIGRNLVDGGM
jgi:hypothetical protein